MKKEKVIGAWKKSKSFKKKLYVQMQLYEKEGKCGAREL